MMAILKPKEGREMDQRDPKSVVSSSYLLSTRFEIDFLRQHAGCSQLGRLRAEARDMLHTWPGLVWQMQMTEFAAVKTGGHLTLYILLVPFGG